MIKRFIFFVLAVELVFFSANGFAMSDGETIQKPVQACPLEPVYTLPPYGDCWVLLSSPCDVPRGWRQAKYVPKGESECIPANLAVDDNSKICAQVLTYAKAPYEKCWVIFNSPCDVPKGWQQALEIPEGESECMPDTDPIETSDLNSCASFDFFSGTLNIPCFQLPNLKNTLFQLQLAPVSVPGVKEPTFVLRQYKVNGTVVSPRSGDTYH